MFTMVVVFCFIKSRTVGVLGNLSRGHHTADRGRRPADISNMATLREVVSTLKEMAPPSLAESWDNVGLLVEPSVDVQRPVARVLLTNDLTEDVQQEAEDTDTDLIVAYHPPLFRPFKRITLDTWKVSFNARSNRRPYGYEGLEKRKLEYVWRGETTTKFEYCILTGG